MRAAKIDSNQVEIISYLRDKGCKVLHLHTLKNCCDALVGYRGKLFLIEIKDGKKPKSQRQLTDGEKKFFAEWVDYPLFIVQSIEDCETILKTIELSDEIKSFNFGQPIKIDENDRIFIEGKLNPKISNEEVEKIQHEFTLLSQKPSIDNAVVLKTNDKIFPEVEVFVDFGKEKFQQDEKFEKEYLPADLCKNCFEKPRMNNSTLCGTCFAKLEEDF